MNTRPTRTAGIVAAAGFLGCIVAANYAVTRWGMQPVGFGLVATAGTYFAGATFVLRDTVQDAYGRKGWGPVVTVALIVAGAALSALLSPQLAAASAAAFLVAELLDLGIYTPLRSRGYLRAAVVSNVVGAVADSWLFLTLAQGTPRIPPVAVGLPGQVIGKVWITVAVVVAVLIVRRWIRARRAVAA